VPEVVYCGLKRIKGITSTDVYSLRFLKIFFCIKLSTLFESTLVSRFTFIRLLFAECEEYSGMLLSYTYIVLSSLV
jgi:hypothetical protein